MVRQGRRSQNGFGSQLNRLPQTQEEDALGWVWGILKLRNYFDGVDIPMISEIVPSIKIKSDSLIFLNSKYRREECVPKYYGPSHSFPELPAQVPRLNGNQTSHSSMAQTNLMNLFVFVEFVCLIDTSCS